MSEIFVLNRQSIQLLAEEYLFGDLDKSKFVKLYNEINT